MILFVDLEHASTFEKPKTDWLLAWRARITYRLEDVSGHTCLLQRYSKVTPDLVERLGVQAVFISGQGAPQEVYAEEDLTGLRELVVGGVTPVFGFCGGLQFIARSLGVPVERVGPIPEGEPDLFDAYEPGWRKEVGYQPIQLVADHPLVEGLGPEPVMRHAHTYELKAIPDGFDVLASTDVTSLQLLAHRDGLLAGSQFHPEYWTDEHPAGRRLVENFCRWVGLG